MKISIVTPSLNQGPYLERCIQSVLSQPGDLEHLVMDGGSTDNSVEILQSFADRHPNFSFVSEPDKGQSDAINKGLARCSGHVLAYLNADDEYVPDAFHHVREFFQSNPDCMWAYGKYAIVDETGTEIRRFFSRYKHRVGRRFSYRKLLRINPVPQPATFWRADIYREFGGFDPEHHLVMDYEYWCRIGEKYPARQIPHQLALYRFYSDSKSGASFVRQYREELEVAKNYARGRFPLAIFLHRLHFLRTVLLFRVLQLIGK